MAPSRKRPQHDLTAHVTSDVPPTWNHPSPDSEASILSVEVDFTSGISEPCGFFNVGIMYAKEGQQ